MSVPKTVTVPLALSSMTNTAPASSASGPKNAPSRLLCSAPLSAPIVVEVSDGMPPEKVAPVINDPVKLMMAASVTSTGAVTPVVWVPERPLMVVATVPAPKLATTEALPARSYRVALSSIVTAAVPV